MLNTGQLVKIVQSMLEDPDGTTYTFDYLMGFMRKSYVKLATKLRNYNEEFDEQVIELPGVAAGTTNLDQYMIPGKPLSNLMTPRMIEWKLAGQSEINYRESEGPIAKVRDMVAGPVVDSWSYLSSRIFISPATAAVDLRITGNFLFPNLVGPNSPITAAITAEDALSDLVALAVAKARGNAQWVQQYGADAQASVSELRILLVKQQQGETRRVGRMSRRMVSADPRAFKS